MMAGFLSNLSPYFNRYFSSDYNTESESVNTKKGIEWMSTVPFIILHGMCLGIIWAGWSPFAVWFAVIFYLIRMFGITAFYHRYFSHRAFQANRFFSFLFALLGTSAIQKGPLWWAAIHRHHHMYADTEKDIHSPKISGFWWSHIGWIMATENRRTRIEYLKDWLKFPELVLLDKFSAIVPFAVGYLILLTGDLLHKYAPQIGTNGPQLLIWGFFVSTVFCSHMTFSINSFDHMYGSRRYDLPNTSRNNWLFAILTLGEGWHNNHHHYPITAKAGFYWWEIDVTYYLLVMLSWLHIVRDLRPLSKEKRDENQIGHYNQGDITANP
jgi:stearoyl-CoA desaturase (delta-9 desaturase)